MSSIHIAHFALDIPTLLLVAAPIAVLLGLFLLLSWAHDRAMRALVWWGAAYLIGGGALMLWNAPLAWDVPEDIPGALMFLACGMIWNGVRLFHGRATSPLTTMAGAIVWLIATQMPLFADGAGARLVLGTVAVSIYTFFIARELRYDRRKAGRSWRKATIVPLVHAGIFLLPVLLNEMVAGASRATFSGIWLELFAIETTLYAVGAAFIVLMMVKDYHVQSHKTAASTDPLTGLFNRRAFFESASELCRRASRAREPVSVLMFDLDRFKAINDRFGHATGDDVLRRFARVAGVSMRATDVVGRLGGEEFAAIVPGGPDVAALVAERVRANFEIAGMQVGEHRIGATVSIGGACAHDASPDIHRLLSRADAALYVAKQDGRNRISIAEEPVAPHPVSRHIAAARAARLPVVDSPALAPAPGDRAVSV